MTEVQGLSAPEDPTAGVPPLVETFDSFYTREYRSILALANVLVGNHAAAEDLTQECFVAAFRSWPAITQPDHWVRSVVSRQAMSWWRRFYASKKAMVRLYEPTGGVASMPADSEAFWGEVRSLPARQAQAIALYYLEDRSTDEIAEILGCETSTVRIHLSRGRKTLASRLEVDL